MAEDNVIARVTQARADLKKMRDMVERCFAILCRLTGWNPKEGMTEEEILAENMKQVDPVMRSGSKALVKLMPEDLLNLKRAQETVDAATIATCKMYAKKIAQLTHPDKIMRFSAKTKAELLDVFHHSLHDLEDNNHAGLVYAYIHVRILRGESRHVPEELYEVVEVEYEWLNKQIRHILSLKFVPAANAYCDGKIPLARMLFMDYINHVRAERKKKRDLDAMREEMAAEEAARREESGEDFLNSILKERGETENDDTGGMALETRRAEIGEETSETAGAGTGGGSDSDSPESV